MLRLAVSHRAETFERIRDPLASRGIDAAYVASSERTVSLRNPPWDEFDVGFVYPSRPMEGGVLDAVLDVPWLNDREAILTSRNKAGVIAALEREGVPVPDTVMVSNPVDDAEVRAVFERFDPPVVVKPNSTTRGVGVAKVHDVDSFLGVVDYLNLVHEYPATADKSFLVQEYLPDARDYRAMVLDGEYVGAVERTLPDSISEAPSGSGETESRKAVDARQWKHNVHRGAEATGVDLPERLRTLAEETASALDIPLLGVDLLVTDDGAFVTETNARPTIDSEHKYENDFYDRLAASIRAQVEE